MSRRSAEDRLRRLLVMLPWLMERGETPVREVARRFDLSPAEVSAELELAALCGLPPFVDEMIDVYIDDDVVFVGVPRLFTRPLALTSPEGFALLAAGRAAMQLPGADPDGALGRGLRKLAAALGEADPADSVVVDLPHLPGLDDTLAALSAAVTTAERVAIRYWTASRDEVTERTITPRRVFSDHDDWYVVADDQRSGERRTFRVDRIEAWERTGVHDERPAADEGTAGGDPQWFADGGLAQVTLRLSPEARWVTERYPVDRVAGDDGGRLVATLPVTSETWLARLLVRLGPAAEVVAPTEWRDLGARTARRVLARYAAS